jgi:uncharacterized membrane protein YbjE (DUF340 family)
MFYVIAFLLAGFIFGKILPSKNILWIQKLISVLIWLLLFLLGLEMGKNDTIFNQFHLLGFDAFLLTIFAVFGSLISSSLVWKWINKSKK